MTRKDYELIAAAIRETELPQDGFKLPERELAQNIRVASAIADKLAMDNPRFDRGRFMKACNGNS